MKNRENEYCIRFIWKNCECQTKIDKKKNNDVLFRIKGVVEKDKKKLKRSFLWKMLVWIKKE